MTDVAPALTSDELAALAGPSVPRWFAVYDTTSGNVVATAQVDAPFGLTYPLVSLPVKNTSTGWLTATSVSNLTILIGSTPGGCDRGIYRVRQDVLASSTGLAIMAVGENDSGRINVALRSSGISDDDYITVLDRFDPFGVNPRIAYDGIGVDANIYEDWALLGSASQFNRYPPPRVNLSIDGEPGNYGTHVWGGTSKTFTIIATIGLWPTSASVTWAFTLPTGWTLNSGSLTGSGTTATINVTAPHSADTYTLHFDATENNGSIFHAVRKVWITSFTYPPLSITRIDSRVDDQTGSRRTITFNQLPVVPPGAMWHLFNAGTWNGQDVPTASKRFTGWMQRRRETTGIGVSDVTLDLIGPSYMLDLIGAQSQIMYATSSTPANWQQLYIDLSYLDFAIWWIVFRRASGFLQYFNYVPFGLTNTEKRMSGWQFDTGTLLSQIKAQIRRYGGGNFGCNPNGGFVLRRHVSRVPWSERSGIPVRANLTARNYQFAELNFEEHPNLRRLRGECFVSDAVTDTPVWCDAPVVPGQGQREDKVDRLICDSADELYEFTGNEFNAQNNPYSNGTIKLRNWSVFYPAEMSRVGLDIAPALHFDGQEYSGYVIVKQVSYTYNADGTVETTLTVEAETVGLPGVDVEIPSPDTGLNAATRSPSSAYLRTPFVYKPLYKSTNPNPAGTSAGAAVLPRDGSLNFCGVQNKAYVVSNFLSIPAYRDVTPASLGSFAIQHGMLQIGGKRAWLLGSDLTPQSSVWSCANVFAASPAWSKGANVANLYSLLRSTSTPGSILIYSPGVTATPTTFNFLSVDGGFVATTAAGESPSTHGAWSAGTGWYGTSFSYNSGSAAAAGIRIHLLFGSPITINSAQVTYNLTKGSPFLSGFTNSIQLFRSGSFVAGSPLLPANTDPDGTGKVLTVPNGTYLIDEIYLYFITCNKSGGGLPATPGSVVLTSLSYSVGGGNVTVHLSNDDGATFGSGIVVGTSVGSVGGFDVQYGGTVNIATCTGKTRKAATLGGSFSDDQAFSTNPILVVFPWSHRNSTALDNTGSSPQYIVGLSAPDGSGHTLYWIVSGTPVNITPVIGGNPGIPAGPNCLTTYLGKYIAYLGIFGGTTHLVTSKDAGTTWVDRGAVNSVYARVRRLATSPGQFVVAGTVLDYTGSFGASLIAKAKPSSSDLVFWEFYG